MLLQILLQLPLILEEKSASYFKKKSGGSAEIMRILSVWAILFIRKWRRAPGDVLHRGATSNIGCQSFPVAAVDDLKCLAGGL